jgi:hypothetical protein
MIAKYAYYKPFNHFPDRCEWKDGLNSNRKERLISYADGSKTSKGTGAGVYGYGTRKILSFSLGQYSTAQYSRQKCIPLWNAWLRIYIGTTGIGTSAFCQIAKLQSKL